MPDTLPPGFPPDIPSDGAPFMFPTPEEMAALPHDDVGPRLYGSIWPLTVLAGLFMGLRLYCKLSRGATRLWWDDFVLIASWLCIFVETVALTVMTKQGYGRHVWDVPVDHIQTMVINISVAGSFSLVAATWSKTSFAISMLRLVHGWQRVFIWFIIITVNVAMGVSAALPWTYCKPVQKSWNPIVPGTCLDLMVLVKYDIFSAVYSALMDFTLAILPWTVIWKLQMKKPEKLGVGIAMSMGFFAGIFALVKTSKIPKMTSLDFADGTDLFIWGNAETTVTIIAASIPPLRVLLRDVKASRAYGSSARGTDTNATNTISLKDRSVMSGAVASPTVEGAPRDDDSDRSMVDDRVVYGGILRTDAVSIEYHSRKDLARRASEKELV